jgi:hypothetical protein
MLIESFENVYTILPANSIIKDSKKGLLVRSICKCVLTAAFRRFSYGSFMR